MMRDLFACLFQALAAAMLAGAILALLRAPLGW